jgi:hypothetical protein
MAEANTHQEIRKVLLEQTQKFNRENSHNILENQLAEERLVRHDLEAKIRQMELNSLS